MNQITNNENIINFVDNSMQMAHAVIALIKAFEPYYAENFDLLSSAEETASDFYRKYNVTNEMLNLKEKLQQFIESAKTLINHRRKL